MAHKSNSPGMAMILGIGNRPKRNGPVPPPPGRQAAPAAQPEPEMPEQHQEEYGEGIPPEAVGYRTSEQVCGSCAHMGQDGNCTKLMIPVSPGDGCALHSPSEMGAADYEETEPGAVEQPL